MRRKVQIDIESGAPTSPLNLILCDSRSLAGNTAQKCLERGGTGFLNWTFPRFRFFKFCETSRKTLKNVSTHLCHFHEKIKTVDFL